MRRIILFFLDKYFRLKKSGVDYARYKGVSVGKDCRIYTTSFGSEPWMISIGNKVTITSGVVLLTHDGSTWLMSDENGRRYLYKRIVIGNHVFIGVNSILMPGVKVEDNVIVAAGSVVTKSIPSGVIVAGNPARIIGDYETHKQNVLKNYVSDKDINLNKDYMARIEEVIVDEFKDFMN
jgi:acetyltransferase-like isoleucine patch superfamily enzyme